MGSATKSDLPGVSTLVLRRFHLRNCFDADAEAVGNGDERIAAARGVTLLSAERSAGGGDGDDELVVGCIGLAAVISLSVAISAGLACRDVAMASSVSPGLTTWKRQLLRLSSGISFRRSL